MFVVYLEKDYLFVFQCCLIIQEFYLYKIDYLFGKQIFVCLFLEMILQGGQDFFIQVLFCIFRFVILFVFGIQGQLGDEEVVGYRGLVKWIGFDVLEINIVFQL